jgi:hypothetical protein
MSDASDFVLRQLLALYLRPWVNWSGGPVWDPPLTSGEQATLADLSVMANFGITSTITLAEYQAIKPDLALGRAFLGIASPTNAQAVAAEKAIIRVIGALLRDA